MGLRRASSGTTWTVPGTGVARFAFDDRFRGWATPLRGPGSRAPHRAPEDRVSALTGFDPCRGERRTTPKTLLLSPWPPSRQGVNAEPAPQRPFRRLPRTRRHRRRASSGRSLRARRSPSPLPRPVELHRLAAPVLVDALAATASTDPEPDADVLPDPMPEIDRGSMARLVELADLYGGDASRGRRGGAPGRRLRPHPPPRRTPVRRAGRRRHRPRPRPSRAGTARPSTSRPARGRRQGTPLAGRRYRAVLDSAAPGRARRCSAIPLCNQENHPCRRQPRPPHRPRRGSFPSTSSASTSATHARRPTIPRGSKPTPNSWPRSRPTACSRTSWWRRAARPSTGSRRAPAGCAR